MFDITKLSPDQIEDQPVLTVTQTLTKRVDFVNDNLFYKGWSLPGTLPSAAEWKIVRVNIGNDGDVIEEWADGNDLFDNVWNDRLTKGYS